MSGLALCFAPKLASDVREGVAKSATKFRDAAGAVFQTAANEAADVVDVVADAADEVAARGHAIRDGVADAVEHGAHALSHSAKEVERFARASKTDHDR